MKSAVILIVMMVTASCNSVHNCKKCGKKEDKILARKMIPTIDSIYYDYYKKVPKWRFVKCWIYDSPYVFTVSPKKRSTVYETDVLVDTNLRVLKVIDKYGPID
jgi:hypothetical protein